MITTSENPVGRILVVDDEIELKNALVDALLAQSYEVHGFTSGQEALVALRAADFDLLISDLMMPEMDGIELIKAAMEIDPHLVAIIMTGQGTIQTAVEAMQAGTVDYVLKPFRLQTLMPILTRAINTRRLRKENLQLRETLAIYELAQTIAFTLDSQTLISKLADAALQQTDADEVSLLLPTDDGAELYVAAVRGENRKRLLGERIPLKEGISSWVARERLPLILNGEVHDERFVAHWPRPEIRSAVSVPMQVANKLIGIINLNVTNGPRPFTLGQMKALTILASTGAAALESASLYRQVQQAEEKYRSIFENAIDGIFQATPEGRFIIVNASLARILGYDSPQEMIAAVTTPAQFYVDSESRVEAARIEQEEGILRGFEFQAYRKDGTKIWLSGNRHSVRNEAGVKIYREGSVQDITERKRGEAQRELLSALVQASPDYIGYADPKTAQILYINKHGRRMCGIGEDEDLGNLKISDVHPAWMNQRMAEVVLPTAVRDGLWEGDGAFLHRDGTEIPVSMVLLARKAANGEVDLFYTVSRDITERKRADDALRESEERYKGLIDSAFDGVVILRDRTIVSANRAYAEMFGYSVDEVIGQSVLKFTASEYQDVVLNQIAQPESTYESVGLSNDGTRIPIEISGQVCMYDGQPARLAAVRDITGRKRVEETQTRRAAHALFRADVSAALAVSRAPLRATLELCATAMVQHLSAAFARVWTLNSEEDVLELQASAGMYTHIDGAHGRVPVGSFKIGKIAQERVPHITNDVQTDPRVSDKEWAQREGMVAFAGYPLLLEKRLLGVMAMFSRTKLAEDTLDALASVADLMSQGIERKRAEKALKASESRKDAILKTALDCVITIDHEGHIIDFNPAAEHTFGYAREDVVGKKMADLMVPPSMRPDHERGFARYLTTGCSSMLGKRIEVPAMRADGSEIPVELTITAIGELPHPTFTAFIRDLTERRRAEAELKQSEERYRDLVENAHDIIYSHDLEGNYSSMNKAGESITGYPTEEALTMNLSQMVSSEYLPLAQEMLERKLAGENVTAYELELIAKDGHRVAVEANTKLVLQNGVPVGVQGIARDVTERKHLEDQLRQSQKLEGIGQLAGGIAHDFNNLLTAINGYSSLALQRIEGNPSVRTYLEEIKKAGDRAANLTRQLLAFGRKQILQPLPLNLNDTVTDMSKMLQRLIGEDIQLSAKLTTDLKRVKADPGQIEQVLVNLIVNARDAMPQGGKLTIETANVELDREYASTHVGVHPGAYVVLAVSDTGTGMDEQLRQQIFEPFFTTKEKGKGTGLGLSTVYGIVKQSGGNIWVYSEPNHGTTFKVYLPALAPTSKSTEVRAVESPIPGGSETVLLVEDEELVRGLACQILEDAGYRVLVAKQGEEAIRLCIEHAKDIHLLLTDVVMPGAGGKEVADRLGALRPGIKVLFMSGYTDEAIVHHGVLDSNVKFIQKPFSPAALAKKVREVLDSNGTRPTE